MGTTRSGWCLRPMGPGSKEQHDKCPKNFATGGVCSCDCDHPSERPRESLVAGSDWPMSWRAQLDAGRGKGAVVMVPEAEEEVLDKPAQPVYTERVQSEGGAEALRKLHGKGEGAGHVQAVDAGEPERKAG